MTQVNTTQVHDGSIFDHHVATNASIQWPKLDLTAAVASDIGAEFSLTFSAPFVRTGNTISLDTTYLGVSGYSGISGISGISGYSGYSGSGISGYSGDNPGSSGISGYSGDNPGSSGWSGFSGSGISGWSGVSGAGWSGYSGAFGLSGASGKSGWSGMSGDNPGSSGFSGKSGYSGYSGYSGSGISGWSGYSGSGVSGWSGFSGLGLSGFSGWSGWSGRSGFSGSGISGWSGISGNNPGSSGFSGWSGISGYSSYSGFSGWSGISGIYGFSGFSGKSGFSGLSGNNPGSSGISGWSGYSSISGWSGYSGYSSISGFSGWSGISGDNPGSSGFSGWSGISGDNPGSSGWSGFSGDSGISGFSGSGISGESGFSGYSGYSGVGISGYSGTNGTGGGSGGVTLQVTDPGTPDAGGVNITGGVHLGITMPSGLTLSSEGTAGTSSYTYTIAATVNGVLSSGNGVGFGTGNAVLDVTNFNRLTWSAVANATGYEIWRVYSNGIPSDVGHLTATPVVGLSYDDTGVTSFESGQGPIQNFSSSITTPGGITFYSPSDSGGTRLLTVRSNNNDKFVFTGEGSLRTLGYPIFFQGDINDNNDFVKWDNVTDRMQIFGFNGVDLGANGGGGSALTVKLVSQGAGQLIITSFPFSTVTAGNITVPGLNHAISGPTITNTGTPGTTNTVYQIVALLADGSTTTADNAGYTATANATQDGDNFNHLEWAAVPGAYSYDVYRVVTDATSPATTGKINTNPVIVLIFDDTGHEGGGQPLPENNTGIVTARLFATQVGGGIPTAATISPAQNIHHITDATTPIATITPPYTGFIGTITLIPDAAFTTTTGGNIAIISTAVIGKALIMTCDGTSWYPSY